MQASTKANYSVMVVCRVSCVSGNVGDVLAGIVLDKTRRYRATCIVVYILTLASYAGFLFVIKTKVWLFV